MCIAAQLQSRLVRRFGFLQCAAFVCGVKSEGQLRSQALQFCAWTGEKVGREREKEDKDKEEGGKDSSEISARNVCAAPPCNLQGKDKRTVGDQLQSSGSHSTSGSQDKHGNKFIHLASFSLCWSQGIGGVRT